MCRIWLSRDRFGQKPLYWWRERGLFAFASELTAITQHHRIETTIDPVAVRKYFGYGFIPPPRSICPPEIVQRKKQGFGIPAASWIAESKPPFDAEPRSAFARARVDAHKTGAQTTASISTLSGSSTASKTAGGAFS